MARISRSACGRAPPAWDFCEDSTAEIIEELIADPALLDDVIKAVMHEVCDLGPELCPQQGGAIPIFSAIDDRSGGFAFARDAESRSGGGDGVRVARDAESGNNPFDPVPPEVFSEAYDANFAALASIDDSIAFFPGGPVPLDLDQFLPVIAFEALDVTRRDSFMWAFEDFISEGDGIFFSNELYRTTIFDVQFEFYGIKPGLYTGSDINYYYQGLLTARSWNFTMLNTELHIQLWNRVWQDHAQQIPRARAWAWAGVEYYDDVID